MRRSALAALTLLLALPGSPAPGWVVPGTEWDPTSTVMSLNMGATWNPQLEAALSEWNDVPAMGFNFFWNFNNENRCGTDGNAVEFDGGECYEWDNELAVEVSSIDPFTDEFINSVVMFNTAKTWTTSQRTCDTSAPVNLRSVALHEFGHTLGLAHENRWLATMNSLYHPIRSIIHADDRAGARHLYPSGSSDTNLMVSEWERTSTSANDAAHPTDILSGFDYDAGDPIRFEFTLENGGKTTVSNFSVGYYLDDEPFIGTFLNPRVGGGSFTLSAGSVVTLVGEGTIPQTTPTGEYYVGAVVDPDNLIAESSEVDNRQWGCETIFVRGKVDYEVLPTEIPAQGPAGGEVSVTANIRNNFGDPGASPVSLLFHLSEPGTTCCNSTDIRLATIAVDPIPGNTLRSLPVSLVIPENTPLGTYDLVTTLQMNDANGSNHTNFGSIDVVQCVTSGVCNDGVFCNGTSVCIFNRCTPPLPPFCDDGVACTRDFCSPLSDSCVSIPVDDFCDDGIFCNGTERCNAVTGCEEDLPRLCIDFIDCTQDGGCDEVNDTCIFTPNDAFCDDGLFCNGPGLCEPGVGCSQGSPPCDPWLCDEASDTCQPDMDGDGVADADDNCVDVYNPSQSDLGREIRLLGGSGPDGIGDACQCGDLDGDGDVDGNDRILLRERLADPLGLETAGLCNTIGPRNAGDGDGNLLRDDCNVADWVVSRRNASLRPPGIDADACAGLPEP